MTTPRESELDGAAPRGAADDPRRPASHGAPEAVPTGADTTSAEAERADGDLRSAEPAAAEPSGATGPQTAPPSNGPQPVPPADPGSGWSQGTGRSVSPAAPAGEAGTVLPGGGGVGPRRAASARPVPPRPAGRPGAATGRPLAGRSRRARLSLRRIDPWSVFLFSLVASVFLGIALVVAVAVMYAVLGSLGVVASINELFAEVFGGSPLLTSGRIVGGAAVLGAVNVVFLTLLATLGSLLYNLCASFTGGIELTLGERD